MNVFFDTNIWVDFFLITELKKIPEVINKILDTE